MTARPRKNTESPEEYYHVKDHDSLIQAIEKVNLTLFAHYLVDQGIKDNDFEHQKMFAEIYNDMIHALLIDFTKFMEENRDELI